VYDLFRRFATEIWFDPDSADCRYSPMEEEDVQRRQEKLEFDEQRCMGKKN
jgi:hypothetical protein